MADYGVRYWLDDIARLWGEIEDDAHHKVISYLTKDIPESVNQVPCVLTFLDGDVDGGSPSLGSSNAVTYQGKSEFHLTSSLIKNQMPYVMSFVDKILAKAAANMTLGGKVVSFRLASPGAIKFVRLTWGNENEHYGLQVNWQVIENHTNKYPVSP